MDHQRKIVLVSLAASLMAVILYIFGFTLAKHNLIIQIIYTLLSSLLVIVAIISLLNNFKKYKKALFVYLIIVNIILEVLFIYNLII